ncbi:MAG: DUF523 domain-containing protein [Deltaproteobacteria bacterium]|nr:DUF523 domain-containing protein [Deltaproteobacteria bacterium]
MLKWAANRNAELEKGLCGFIFKGNSPSCAVQGVEVYNGKGMPVKKGIGIFARVFKKHVPLLPIEDEERLQDTKLRHDFIEKCSRQQRLKNCA